MNPATLLLLATFAICSMFLNQQAHAATVGLSWPDNVVFDGDGNPYYKTPSGSTRPVYPDIYNQPKTFNAPTPKGNVPVTVPYKMPVKLSKVGKAATNFLKRVGPIATAVAVAGLVCDLTDICSNDSDGDGTADEFIKVIPPPPDLPTAYYWQWLNGHPTYPDAQSMCNYVLSQFPNYTLISVDAQPSYAYCNLKQGSTINNQYVGRYSGCPTGYVSNGAGGCQSTTSASQRPLTEQDWEDAEPQLNTPEVTSALQDVSEPVPVENPVIQPTTKTVDTSTTTTRDATGTATGTQTETTTVTASPHPTQPNTVNVTTTTVITNYDINNNVTNTTTTENDPPDPPKEQEPDDPDFDNVEDEDLPEHEIGQEFSWNSWGGGSCPADKQLNVLGTQQVISMQPTCDFMTGIRPFILIIAGLISAYIIIGSRNE